MMEYSAIPCWFYLSFSLVLVLVSGQRIPCTVSGNVHEQESAWLTCDYRTDLEEHGVGFYIYRYPLGGGDPDLPAICDWDNDFLRCDVKPGYKVRVEGHTMTLNISAARQSHAGRYECHVLQSENDTPPEGCDLIVQNGTVACHEVADPFRELSSTIMCFVPRSLNGVNVSLERLEPDGKEFKRIIRCDMRTNMCDTKYLGYQFDIGESSSTGFKVLVAVVTRAGHYTCTVQGSVSKNHVTCSLGVQKDTVVDSSSQDTVVDSSSQQTSPVTLVFSALLATSVLTLVFVMLCYYSRKFSNLFKCTSGESCDTVAYKSDTQTIDLPGSTVKENGTTEPLTSSRPGD